MTLCDTCKKADVSCPVYPMDTQTCVEYSNDNSMKRDVRTTVTEATVNYVERNPWIEPVAAGLRAMDQKPDALLWCGSDVYVDTEILGIPIFYSAGVTNPYTDDPVPFIPLWRSEGNYWISRRRFNDGYMEGMKCKN